MKLATVGTLGVIAVGVLGSAPGSILVGASNPSEEESAAPAEDSAARDSCFGGVVDSLQCDHDFGSVLVGETASGYIGAVYNAGQGPICLVSKQTTNSSFSLEFPVEVAPGLGKRFRGEFQPSQVGYAEAVVEVALEADPPTVVCHLQGTGR